MNLKFSFNTLRRRTLLLFVVVALSAAMLPTAAFASGYGHQGRGWDPGPRQQRGEHRPAQEDRHGNKYDYDQDHDKGYDKHYNDNHNNKGRHQPQQCQDSYRVKRGDTLSGIAKYF